MRRIKKTRYYAGQNINYTSNCRLRILYLVFAFVLSETRRDWAGEGIEKVKNEIFGSNKEKLRPSVFLASQKYNETICIYKRCENVVTTPDILKNEGLL